MLRALGTPSAALGSPHARPEPASRAITRPFAFIWQQGKLEHAPARLSTTVEGGMDFGRAITWGRHNRNAAIVAADPSTMKE
jgi:hypothetical protein